MCLAQKTFVQSSSCRFSNNNNLTHFINWKMKIVECSDGQCDIVTYWGMATFSNYLMYEQTCFLFLYVGKCIIHSLGGLHDCCSHGKVEQIFLTCFP